jgi:hypothetical protein
MDSRKLEKCPLRSSMNDKSCQKRWHNREHNLPFKKKLYQGLKDMIYNI